MMQIANRGTLLQDIHYDLASRHQRWFASLLLRMVGSHSSNECSRVEIFPLQEILTRRSAGDANITLTNGVPLISRNRHRNSKFARKAYGKPRRPVCAQVVGIGSLNMKYPGQGPELNSPLITTAAD